LVFLISTTWLTDEAKRLGLAVSSHAVDQIVSERRKANGEAEFDEGLHATGKTAADVEREIRAELTLAAIRGRLVKQATAINDSEIEAFYNRNRQMFVVPEARNVDLIETLSSRSSAQSLVKRVGSGPRFAKLAFHETPVRSPRGTWRSPEKEAVLRAIFAARPGMVSAPMKLDRRWAVFVVRKIMPARLEPLDKVRSEVVQRLTAGRRKQIATKFAREYKARWTTRTSCSPGYVVPGCAQYAGPIVVEENPFVSG